MIKKKMGIFVSREVDEVSESEVRGVKDALLEKMWREVWKECVDLPDVKVRVERIGEKYKITAEI